VDSEKTDVPLKRDDYSILFESSGDVFRREGGASLAEGSVKGEEQRPLSSLTR